MSRDAAVRKKHPDAMPGLDYAISAATGEIEHWNEGKLGRRPSLEELDAVSAQVEQEERAKKKAQVDDLAALRASDSPDIRRLLRVLGLA